MEAHYAVCTHLHIVSLTFTPKEERGGGEKKGRGKPVSVPQSINDKSVSNNALTISKPCTKYSKHSAYLKAGTNNALFLMTLQHFFGELQEIIKKKKKKSTWSKETFPVKINWKLSMTTHLPSQRPYSLRNHRLDRKRRLTSNYRF